MSGIKDRISSYLGKISESGYMIPSGVSSTINYLIDSYFFKYSEINKKNSMSEEMVDPFISIQEDWLGCDVHKSKTVSQTFPAYFKDRNVYAFWCLFKDSCEYEIVPFLDTHQYKHVLKNKYVFSPQSSQISISLNERLTLPVFGMYFVKNKSTGANLIVSIDFCFESSGCTVLVMSNPDSKLNEPDVFFDRYRASIIANDIYFKKCIEFNRGSLDFCSVTPTSWNSIILKKEIVENIYQNTLGVINNRDALNNLGMCPSRNVLLVSPPGMAKTTIFRAISVEVMDQITCIWCTGKSIKSSNDVTSLFQVARQLAPCIIFIEDMDLFGGDRSSSYEPLILNEFLACLDGHNENHGVVVLASTNDIESMDEALIDRPGRFDNKIEIPFPDSEDRTRMLSSFFSMFNAKADKTVTKETWKNVIEMTDGLTGAYMKDLARTVVLKAVSGNGLSTDKSHVVFNNDHMVSATEHVIKNWRIGKRAKKHHRYTSELDISRSE